MRRLAFALAVSVPISSCAMTVIGRPVNREAVEQLVPGHTDLGRVRELFGEPLRVVKAEGREIVVYRYADPEGYCEEIVISAVDGKITAFSSKFGGTPR